jgi:two-component system LytT family response regulator
MAICTLVVDDEELCRRAIRTRLERARDFAVVGECTSGREAVAAIRRAAPDLVFLDVQMPGMSGFEVMKSLPGNVTPRVIFVTAFDHHAVRAFDVHALDYLLKPIDEARFAAALGHARAALAAARTGLAREPGARLAVQSGERVVILRVAEIDWVEASGNYVSLHVGARAWLRRETIAQMEQRLMAHGFARIHRSTLVNIDRISELRSGEFGDASIVLCDGTVLRQSRGYSRALEQLVG